MDALPFHWIDIVAIVLTVLSILFGFFRGFTREFLAILAWLGAAVVTDMMFDWTSSLVAANFTSNTILVAGIAAIGVFIILLIIFMLLGGPLWRSVRRSSFWLVDSVVGLFLGLARGILVLFLLAIALAHVQTNSDRSAMATQSRFLTYADDGARTLLSVTKDLPYERIQRPWFQSMMGDLQKRMGTRLIPSSLESQLREAPVDKYPADKHPADTQYAERKV